MKYIPIFHYQEYLLNRIDTLCFKNSAKPNQTNRVLLHCIADLEALCHEK